MIKFSFLACFLALLSGSSALAQTIGGGSYSSQPSLEISSPPPASGKKPAKGEVAQAPQGPTIIDSENMDYDEKTRIAVFTGENYGVFVKDPSFTVNCDKLTAYMRKASAPGLKGKPSATPAPQPGSAADAAAAKTSGLQRAIAEGTADRPVVIVQDKPAANGEEPEHNVGIADKADYNADTGDIKLTGWPRVTQGINSQIATSEKTVMIMNKDGHTMKTIGPSRSTIEEKAQPEKNDKDSKTKTGKISESPAPSPQ